MFFGTRVWKTNLFKSILIFYVMFLNNSLTCCPSLAVAHVVTAPAIRASLWCYLLQMWLVFVQTGKERSNGKRGGEKNVRIGRGRREHATECPKPLEQGIFLVDWAIHSRHVTLNFFHYKTLLPSPLQRQIACTYFTQWNIASPLNLFHLKVVKKILKQWLVSAYSAQGFFVIFFFFK